MSELRRRLFKVVSESQSEARQRAEPLEEAREGIAQLLRQTRERYGQSLRDVSANLRIRLAYLQAIEEGRFRELPGATYAVGFVRSYAEYLGLDSADIVRRFKGEVEGLESKIHLAFPEPVSEGKVPGGAIILLSLIVLAVGYGGWYAISSQRGEDTGFIPRVTGSFKVLADAEETASAPASDQQSAPAAGPPAEAADAAAGQASGATGIGSPVGGEATQATAPTEPADESGPAAPASPQPAGAAEEEVAIGGPEEDEAVAPSADAEDPAAGVEVTDEAALPAAPDLPAAPADEAASAEPGAAVPDVGAPAQAGSGRITLRARLASWIQISDTSGAPILTRTLAAGETVDVPDQPGLTLFTGNAGGLEILVDGRSLSTLGPVGSVRRNIALDPAALLQQGAAQ